MTTTTQYVCYRRKKAILILQAEITFFSLFCFDWYKSKQHLWLVCFVRLCRTDWELERMRIRGEDNIFRFIFLSLINWRNETILRVLAKQTEREWGRRWIGERNQAVAWWQVVSLSCNKANLWKYEEVRICAIHLLTTIYFAYRKQSKEWAGTQRIREYLEEVSFCSDLNVGVLIIDSLNSCDILFFKLSQVVVPISICSDPFIDSVFHLPLLGSSSLA